MTTKQQNVKLTCLHRLCGAMRTYGLVQVDYKRTNPLS